MNTARRVAIVLFNLGGPDRPAAVEPFLFNLFNDPAIIGAPGPIRWLLAKFIAKRRGPYARKIYDQIGGGSPLLPLTQDQAGALSAGLADLGTVETFVTMRYWHPFADETVEAVKKFGPDKIVLLPLYPQYSTTTSASSFKDWRRAADAAGLTTPTVSICCYPTEAGWINAQAGLIKKSMASLPAGVKFRVLFSAHGLPQKVIDRGDPYQWQVEQTAQAVARALGLQPEEQVVCYQSRVGPLKWIGPATEAEITRAGQDGRAIVLVPIAFVSEHSETLVELDITYKALATSAGVAHYLRVPAVGTDGAFINGLANLVRRHLDNSGVVSAQSGRICPEPCGQCALPRAGVKNVVG